jgi:hypothetical protein
LFKSVPLPKYVILDLVWWEQREQQLSIVTCTQELPIVHEHQYFDGQSERERLELRADA